MFREAASQRLIASFGRLQAALLCFSHAASDLKVGKIKPNGAKAHSSGKLKFPSAQTDAHPASASQAVLILHTAVSRSLAAQTVLWQQKLNHFLVVTFIIHTFADKS